MDEQTEVNLSSFLDKVNALYVQAQTIHDLDWVGKVQEFHRTFRPTILAPTPELTQDEKYYDIGFIREEVRELLAAREQVDLAKYADALTDLVYVTIRAALIRGIDLRPIFQAVHEKNMQKAGGSIRSDGKVLKPDGWEELDLTSLLRSQKPLDTSPLEPSNDKS